MMTDIYHYFDVLPLHPKPEYLESLTSYLTRLAEINGIHTLSDLTAICFPHTSINTLRRESLPPLKGLSVATNCPEDLLKRTTFYHIHKKFEKSHHYGGSGQFLSNYFGLHLRYCPLCLAKSPYYSLLWRFPTLNGCAYHNCKLLDACSYCGSVIQLFGPFLKIGICPHCKKDLRFCKAQVMKVQETRECVAIHKQLVFLLSPQSWENIIDVLSLMNFEKVTHHRQAKELNIKDVEKLIGVNPNILNKIESYGKFRHSSYGVPLRNYLLYFRLLDITFLDLLIVEPKNLEEKAREIAQSRILREYEQQLIREYYQQNN